ncbi:type II toxin-antitoxin system VapC family toxin [[Eubacterium] cellulosolvens]
MAFCLVLNILVDTSFFLLAIKKRLDPFTEINNLVLQKVHFLTTPQVISELKRLETQRRLKISKDAEFALQLASHCTLVNVKTGTGENADISLLKASRRHLAAVATVDVKLRRMIRQNRLPIISLRGNRLYCEPESPELWFASSTEKDI